MVLRRAIVGSAIVAWGCSGTEPAPALDGGSGGGEASGLPVASVGEPGSEASGTTASADTSSGGDDGSSSDGGPPGDDAPSYADVRQKSTHNSYQRHEVPFDQLAYHRVRSLEFDIHTGKNVHAVEPGNWFVYHTDITDDFTWCTMLDDCLGQVAAFHRAVPEHEVITVFVDLKDPWADDHGPGELDAMVTGVFGEALLRPGDLLARCPAAAGVREAGLDCGWPTTSELRGRILVAITGEDATLRAYHDARGATGAAFVAPEVADHDEAKAWNHAAMVDLRAPATALAKTLAFAGYVVRVWDIGSAEQWHDAVTAGVHHLGTDKVDGGIDPWASTLDADGWPFECIDTCAPGGPEPDTIVGIEVDSGDQWARADSAWFVHDDRSGTPDGELTAFVSTRNDHVEPFAKGCLAARASLAADAAYFAVCRPADEEPVRVQVRSTTGADAIAVEADVAMPGTVSPEAVVHLRLRMSEGGQCAAGDASVDGIAWVTIATYCFDDVLVLQGLSASSHDAGVVRLLFGDVRRNGEDARTLGSFAEQAAIGEADGVAFDGPQAP